MKKSKETFTITAALPYANGPIHIGHLAGVYIPADIYARYKRLTENDVAFICGSDEHGVAISLASKKASISPKELIDKYEGDGLAEDKISQSFRIIYRNKKNTLTEQEIEPIQENILKQLKSKFDIELRSS